MEEDRENETIEINFYKLRGRATGAGSIGILEKLMTRGMHIAALLTLCSIIGSLLVLLAR